MLGVVGLSLYAGSAILQGKLEAPEASIPKEA